MKKLQIMAATSFALLLTACGMGKKHTTIVENNNGDKVRIEYRGRTYFSSDSTGIKGMSPNSSVQYTHNDEEIEAESNYRGDITYSVNGGEKQRQLDENGKLLLKQAVKAMMRHGHYADGGSQ